MALGASTSLPKEITIKTGPHGGLGNIAIQTTPYDVIKKADLADVHTSDMAIRSLMQGNEIGHEQRVFRLRNIPASQQSLTPQMAGDNLHITTFKHDYVDGKEVTTVGNGASEADLRKLVGRGNSSLRQVEVNVQTSIHTAGGQRKLVNQHVTLYHEGWNGGRVVAAVDHMKGEGASGLWDRWASLIKENGGKILKHITRA